MNDQYEETIIDRRSPTRWDFHSVVIVLVLVLILLAVVALIFVWTVSQVPVIAYIYIAAVALLPVLGIAYIVVRIYRALIKPHDIPLGQYGTAIHYANNRLHILAMQEMYALQADSRPAQIPERIVEGVPYPTTEQESTRYTMPPLTLRNPVYPPDVYPEEDMVNGVNENGVNGVNALVTARIERVLENVEDEQDRVKRLALEEEDNSLKQQIYQFHKVQKMPLRLVVKLVHLQGKKYPRFKRLCMELGIEGIPEREE